MPKANLTNRDLELFSYLLHLPLTANQAYRLSQTFTEPFQSERVVFRRLSKLASAGYLRRYYFAFPASGRNPAYWRLTSLAINHLNVTKDGTAIKKSRRTSIGVSLHFHSHHVSEVAIQLLLSAKQNGIRVDSFEVEKAIQFNESGEVIVPDISLLLTCPEGKVYCYFVELDTGSERVNTLQRLPSSIKKKLDFYERYRQSQNQTFRVLFVTTSSQQRATNILNFSHSLAQNKAAQLVCAADFESVIASQDILMEPVFQNQRLQTVALMKPARFCRLPSYAFYDGGVFGQLNRKEETTRWTPVTITQSNSQPT